MIFAMLLAILLYAFMNLVDGQSWAVRLDGNGDDIAYALDVDFQGNVLIAGNYKSSPLVVYDYGGSNVSSLPVNGTSGAYVVKYTTSGSFMWAARLDGGGDEKVLAMSTDYQGNLFVAGQSTSPYLVVYDSGGMSVATLNNSGTTFSFVVKYASNGSYLWAARQSGNAGDFAWALTTDQQGNVFVGGSFQSSPLHVYDSSGIKVKSLANGGSNDAYMIKYAANGTYVWANRQAGTGADEVNALSTDPAGNVFIAGDFQPPSLTIYHPDGLSVASLLNGVNLCAFIVKYAPNGSFIWAARLDGSNNDYAYALATSLQGDVFVAGIYGSVPFIVYNAQSANVKSLPNSGSFGSYLVKYAANGSFIWAARQDGSLNEQVHALSTDLEGNVYVCGLYTSNPLVVYNSASLSVKSLANSGSFGAYSIKYAANGTFVFAVRQDSTGDDEAAALSTDQQGNVYIAGMYTSSPLVLFDSGGVIVKTLANNGGYASFIVKYAPDGQWNIKGSINSTTIRTSSQVPTSSSTSWLPSVVSSVSSSSYYTILLSQFQNRTTQSTQVNETSTSMLNMLTIASANSTHMQTFASSVSTVFSTYTLLKSSQDMIDGTESFTTTLFQSTDKVNNLLLSFQGLSHVSTSTSNSIIDRPDTTNLLVSASVSIYYVIILGVGVLSLLVCLLCYFILRRQKRYVTTKPGADFTSVNMEPSYISTDVSLTTAIATSHVLAIPQYLSLQFGLDFIQLDFIVKGGGGSIHNCQVLKIPYYDGCQLVIKNFGKDVNQLNEVIRLSFYQEISMLHLFRDQNQFAKLYGFSEQPATVLLKFYQFGSLKQYIMAENADSSRYCYSKCQVVNLYVQLVKGLHYMHIKQFAHCDVKPENVLLDVCNGMLEPRITDFGISHVLDQTASQVKAFQISYLQGVSISYAGPEVILRFRCQFVEKQAEVWQAGDVYAAAVVLYEMLKRKKVWHMPH